LLLLLLVVEEELFCAMERVFSVCGDLTAGKRNRLTKNLQMRAFLKINLKHYG